MYKGLRTYYNRIIGVILLVNVLFVIANSIVNNHVHVLPSGLIVQHSHPFNHDQGDDASTHKHSNYELYHFNLLSHFLVTSSEIIDVIVEVKRVFFQENIDEVSFCVVLNKSNKSPPFLEAFI